MLREMPCGCRGRRCIPSLIPPLSQQGSLPISCPSRSCPAQAKFPPQTLLIPTCVSLQLPPHTPSLATLLCLVILSHLALYARRLCLAELAVVGNAHGEVMDSAPSNRALSLFPVARINAQCHSPARAGVVSPAKPTPCLPARASMGYEYCYQQGQG